MASPLSSASLASPSFRNLTRRPLDPMASGDGPAEFLVEEGAGLGPSRLAQRVRFGVSVGEFANQLLLLGCTDSDDRSAAFEGRLHHRQDISGGISSRPAEHNQARRLEP